jgi:hypothetical protein
MNEKTLDGIRVDGVPLADVLKDQRDNRIIEVRDREVAVQVRNKKKHKHGRFVYASSQRISSKDRRAGKPRYLSMKQLEEAKMEKQIQTINKEGLTAVEAIYVAFKENNWNDLKSSEIAFATDLKLTSVSSIISKMTKDGMLSREEREPRKFYYSVSEECEDVGRVAWVNMYRELDARLKREKNKKKKSVKDLETIEAKLKKKEKKDTPAEVVENQPPFGNDPRAPEDVANEIHELVNKLDVLVGEACKAGLTVEISQGQASVDSKVYKEY